MLLVFGKTAHTLIYPLNIYCTTKYLFMTAMKLKTDNLTYEHFPFANLNVIYCTLRLWDKAIT